VTSLPSLFSGPEEQGLTAIKERLVRTQGAVYGEKPAYGGLESKAQIDP
jgi:hypothetical protein